MGVARPPAHAFLTGVGRGAGHVGRVRYLAF
jgi:hypothetical protein